MEVFPRKEIRSNNDPASAPAALRTGEPRTPLNWSGMLSAHRTELGQIMVRFAVAVLIGVYLVSAGMSWGFGSARVFWPLIVYAVAVAIAVGHLVHLLMTRRASPVRTGVGIVVDLGSLSLFLHFGDAVTAPFFPFYLWITLANGFRFGERALVFAAFTGLCFFALVTVMTPFWQDHFALAIGMMVALLALPTYVFRLLKHLNEARALAEAANNAKTRFLASISHEVRTPLNAIVGLSDVLRTSDISSDQKQMVRSIGVSAKSLMELMDDVLDYSSIESGQLRQRIEEFSLYDLLAEVEAITLPQAGMRGLDFMLRMVSPVPPVLRGDRQRLREVLLNLTSNALKYTDEGYVALTVGPDAAAWDAGALAQLYFRVEDSGPGIPADQLERIFDSFTQTEEARKSMRGGVGLGLAICKRLVTLLDGTISASSALGEGATFTVSLPFEVASDVSSLSSRDIGESIVCFGGSAGIAAAIEARLGPEVIAARVDSLPALLREVGRVIENGHDRPVVVLPAEGEGADAATECLATLKASLPSIPVVLWACDDAARGAAPREADVVLGPNEAEIVNALAFARARAAGSEAMFEADEGLPSLHILIAEDNRVNRTVASRILQALGHRVDLVEGGEQALEAMAETPYDIVFMDVNMPEVDGLEATRLRRYEEMGSERRTAIIALTADVTTEARQACLDAGMDGVLHKPVGLARMQAAISGLLTERPEIGGAAAGSEPDVSGLSSHPGFSGPLSPILNADKIAELRELDPSGKFLQTVVREFVADATVLLKDLEAAVQDSDLPRFRDTNHALRSCAANVGAGRILEDCARTRKFDRQDFEDKGADLIQCLKRDFDLTCVEMDRALGPDLALSSDLPRLAGRNAD